MLFIIVVSLHLFDVTVFLTNKSTVVCVSFYYLINLHTIHSVECLLHINDADPGYKDGYKDT